MHHCAPERGHEQKDDEEKEEKRGTLQLLLRKRDGNRYGCLFREDSINGGGNGR